MDWSKASHWLGLTPWISTSDPGQNIVPVFRPAFSAVTQIGSAWSHHAVSLLCMVKVPSVGSKKRLETMP